MANVTVTARELKNKNTGIDIYVPKYETIPGHLGSTVMYHVIVVTRLFYFKSKNKYKESDVVQFMVPHKYAAFEELYHKLLQRFSSVIFPALPKKTLIVNDVVLNERRRVIEAVMQQIAKTPKLACSSLTLEFLGVQQVTGATQTDEEDSTQEPKESKPESEEVVEDVDLFASDKQPDRDSGQEEEDKDEEMGGKDDFLSLTKSSSANSQSQGSSIFDVGKDDNDDDIGDLFIPAGAIQKNVVMEVENNSDLLNIEDDLDKLLVSNKPSKPSKPALPKKPVPKPRIKPKPELKPKPAAKTQFEETTGNDDLFKPLDGATGNSKEEELFAPRKSSLRKPSREEESLDDIFKSSAAKSVFPAADEEDDELFKPTSSSSKKLADMDVNDIASYIQLNTKQQNDNLDLF